MDGMRTERSGNVQRRFTVHDNTGKVQIDRLTHATEEVTTLWIRCLGTFNAIFLPEGYPNTVSSDYLTYQKYDTLQALCSSVTGTLGTRSILRGVGVGEASATALSGTVQWIIRDGVGMVGRIGFATRIASDLDNDAKRWRFVADLTNDIAMMLDILASYLPVEYWLVTVCIGALFRAVTAVAGGATRASLTQHFAVCDNTADVSAKDGSQETAVNLIGMFLGMFIAWAVPETMMPTAMVFIFFTGTHLYANYWGVRSLLLCHLNEARATLCLSRYLDSKVTQVGPKVPTPNEVKDLEPVLGRLHLNRRCGGNFDMKLNLGASLYEVLHNCVAPCGPDYLEKVKKEVDQSLARHGYAVVVHHEASLWASSGNKNKKKPDCVSVILTEGISTPQILQAWTLARGGVVPGAEHGSAGIQAADAFNRPFVVTPNAQFLKFSIIFQSKLEEQGWMLNRLQLALRDWRVQGIGPQLEGEAGISNSQNSTVPALSRASTGRKSTVGFSTQKTAVNDADDDDDDDVATRRLELDDGMSPLPTKALTPMRKASSKVATASSGRGGAKQEPKRSSSIRRRGTSFTRD